MTEILVPPDDQQRKRPSSRVLAQLLGEPVPLVHTERIAQAQEWLDESAALIRKADEAVAAGNVARAQELTTEAAAYELGGTLRACTPRQLDALRREAWADLAAIDEEERAADRLCGGGLASLIFQLLRRLLAWLFKVDIGGSGPPERAAVDVVKPVVLDAISAEQRARLDAAAHAEYFKINQKNLREAGRRKVDLDAVRRVESLLSGCAERAVDRLPAARIAVDVAAGYTAALAEWERQQRQGQTLAQIAKSKTNAKPLTTAEIEERQKVRADLIFRVAETHGMTFSDEKKRELFQALREQDKRQEEQADDQDQVRQRGSKG